MIIVLVTVFTLGTTTEMFLNYLQIEVNVDEDKYMENWHRERKPANMILRLEEMIQRNVVRDAQQDGIDDGLPTKVLRDDDDASQQSKFSTDDEFAYGAHVEVTTADHLKHVDSLIRHRKKRRESLFDFGGSTLKISP